MPDAELSDPIDGEMVLTIPELGIEAMLPVKNGRAQTKLEADPARWSPDHPKLYEVTLAFGGDRVSERIGFRSIETSGKKILLNGEPIFLKGVAVHEDGVETGRCTSDDDINRRFADAKELGCNFLRLAHYPHHERAAKIADEMGLLLWEEIPVYWAIDFDNPSTLDDARNQLVELILRDRNRASVIAWGIDDDSTMYSEMHQADYFKRQLDVIRDLDKIAGLCAWLLYDFRTMRRFASYQMGFNRKGLIAEDKVTRKAAFEVVRQAFEMLHR